VGHAETNVPAGPRVPSGMGSGIATPGRWFESPGQGAYAIRALRDVVLWNSFGGCCRSSGRHLPPKRAQATAGCARGRVPAGLAVRLYWRAARLASPGKGRSPNSLPMGVASTLSVVPPRTAAGSRSDPRLGLGVIYGDFGEAALLMQRTRQKVWCWLIGHDGVTRRQGAG